MKRLLKPCWSGTLLGVSIGLGFGLIGTLIELSSFEPVYSTDWGFFLTRSLFPTAIGGVVGLIAGVASGIPKHGLPLLWSLAIVASAAILAIFGLGSPTKGGSLFLFFLTPAAGALCAGLFIALTGLLVGLFTGGETDGRG